ncbi:long-chain-fatty-acid--CoA ligase 1-like [Oppia nitens]|uniref:long-chain-fatty-acid--CoA ligase 1-like n=1 Tax=Oppia nitens TaxID=1686743 RepID=UPI0023DBA6C1|nr:long-chain-fatty-acid--CoA ligase 1-like [Oppia nitens]
MVLECYGLTECSAFVTITQCGDQSSGSLGPPLSFNSVKLMDVKELNIVANKDGIGEICVKGTNVFSGFYNNPEFSEQLFDADGWFHTGDVGQWLKNGTLKILDRKQDIFQLTNSLESDLVCPDKIENIYIQSQYVGQVYIDANYFQSSLLAIIIPDVDGINLWCSENNMLLSAAEACKNVAFKNTVLNDILNIGKREGLSSTEQVTDIALHSEPFTQESGFLTPTMKLKRHECRVHFRELIEEVSKNKDKQEVQKII